MYIVGPYLSSCESSKGLLKECQFEKAREENGETSLHAWNNFVSKTPSSRTPSGIVKGLAYHARSLRMSVRKSAISIRSLCTSSDLVEEAGRYISRVTSTGMHGIYTRPRWAGDDTVKIRKKLTNVFKPQAPPFQKKNTSPFQYVGSPDELRSDTRSFEKHFVHWAFLKCIWRL